MSDDLSQEVKELRQEVESYRQRELDDLRTQLAEAKSLAEHYRAEAERNAEVGRKIYIDSQQEINTLRAKIQASEGLKNERPRFPIVSGGGSA